MNRSVIACSLWLISSTSLAQSSNVERPLLDIFGTYSKSAGVLASCGEGPWDSEIDDIADAIAKWKHPGVWAYLTGERSDYRAEIFSDAMSAYRAEFLRPCDKAPLNADLFVIRSAKTSIDRVTHSD